MDRGEQEFVTLKGQEGAPSVKQTVQRRKRQPVIRFQRIDQVVPVKQSRGRPKGSTNNKKRNVSHMLGSTHDGQQPCCSKTKRPATKRKSTTMKLAKTTSKIKKRWNVEESEDSSDGKDEEYVPSADISNRVQPNDQYAIVNNLGQNWLDYRRPVETEVNNGSSRVENVVAARSIINLAVASILDEYQSGRVGPYHDAFCRAFRSQNLLISNLTLEALFCGVLQTPRQADQIQQVIADVEHYRNHVAGHVFCPQKNPVQPPTQPPINLPAESLAQLPAQHLTQPPQVPQDDDSNNAEKNHTSLERRIFDSSSLESLEQPILPVTLNQESDSPEVIGVIEQLIAIAVSLDHEADGEVVEFEFHENVYPLLSPVAEPSASLTRRHDGSNAAVTEKSTNTDPILLSIAETQTDRTDGSEITLPRVISEIRYLHSNQRQLGSDKSTQTCLAEKDSPDASNVAVSNDNNEQVSVNIQPGSGEASVEIVADGNEDNIQTESQSNKPRTSRATLSSDNRYHCHLCSKTFSASTNLYRHFRQKHGITGHIKKK